MILTCDDLYLSNANTVLLDHICININDHNKIGIIGLNGCGKSTLLKAIAGIVELEKGTIAKEKNTKIAYLSQVVEIEDEDLTVDDYKKDFFKDYKADEFENIDIILKSNLYKLGIFDFSRTMKSLSGGEKRRVMLACTLSMNADLLILDEPTNHLDNEMASWLEKYLIKYNKAILMVTHDRYFLNNVCNIIAELNNGHLSSYVANYEKYLSLKAEEYILNEAINRKRRSFLNKEILWINRGALARTTKDKRRIANYEEEKEKYKEANAKDAELNIDFSFFPRLGNIIVEADNVSKDYGDKKIIDSFSYKLSEKDRIGIVGANGAGKTTLLKLLCGIVSPTKGTVTIGKTVKIGYFSQESENFASSMKIKDYIEEDAEPIYASKLLENFLFTKEMQNMPINTLSGGELRRLALLKVLAKNPNVLLFDEPTNDLDIETLNELENFIDAFKGPVLIVSHDRYFLDKTITKIIEIKENGVINQYLGNYQDYLEKRKENVSVKEDTPKPKQVKVGSSAKLTFNEQREYSTILSEIEKLDEEVESLKNEVNELYVSKDAYKNYNLVKEKEEELKRSEKLLDEKMARWEYLESKK